MRKGRKKKTKFSKILRNNQIIIACCIELWVQETTMNEKLTMIGLNVNWFLFFDVSVSIQFNSSFNTESEMDSFDIV